MTLRYWCGFDSVNIIKYPEWDAVLSNANGRDGVANHACTGNGNNTRRLDIPGTPIDTIIVGFALNMASVGGTSQILPRFTSAAGATVLGSLYVDATSGRWTISNSAGTVLASAPTPFTAMNEWHFVEIKFRCHPTAGIFQVRIDEAAPIINFSGNTGTDTDVDSIQINGRNGLNGFDDMYVLDTLDGTATDGRANNDYLGDVKVAHGIPLSDGTTVTLTPSTGTSHFALVDENPPNQTDWNSGVGGGGSSAKDLYGFTDLNVEAATVYGVRVGLYAAKTDAGSASIKTLIREVAGGETAGATQPLSTTYSSYFSDYYKLRPVGGGVFTPTEVNGMQIGAQVA